MPSCNSFDHVHITFIAQSGYLIYCCCIWTRLHACGLASLPEQHCCLPACLLVTTRAMQMQIFGVCAHGLARLQTVDWPSPL